MTDFNPEDDAWRADLLEQTVPGVVLSERIGSGGFASVYRGWQVSVEREVAVKVGTRVLAGEGALESYRREAMVTASLSTHPGIVTVYDAGTDARGRPYMLMELCRRGSIDDLLRTTGPLPAIQTLRVGIAVAGALAEAHRDGVWHRDVKPANILINTYGEPALSDFGIASVLDARLEDEPTRAFTLGYAPPELLAGGAPSAADDVYSLGLSMYVMVTGNKPAAAREPGTWPTGLPVNSGPASPGLAEVIRRAIDPDPARRVTSASELQILLQSCLVSASPVTPQPDQAATWSRGKRVAIAAIAMVALALAVVGLFVVDGLLRGEGGRQDLAVGSCWQISAGTPQTVDCTTTDAWVTYAVGAYTLPFDQARSSNTDPAVETTCGTPAVTEFVGVAVASDAEMRVLTFRNAPNSPRFACVTPMSVVEQARSDQS